jgi:hypothetical protein
VEKPLQKLSVSFTQEESFTASISIVRALSEGAVHRDPQAKTITADRSVDVRPNPPLKILNPRTRTFRPLSEWQVRMLSYVARTGKTLAQIQGEQSAKRHARRTKEKTGK